MINLFDQIVPFTLIKVSAKFINSGNVVKAMIHCESTIVDNISFPIAISTIDYVSDILRSQRVPLIEFVLKFISHHVTLIDKIHRLIDKDFVAYNRRLATDAFLYTFIII